MNFNYQVENYNIILTPRQMNIYDIYTGELFEYIYRYEQLRNRDMFIKYMTDREIYEYLYYIFEDKSSLVEIYKYNKTMKILLVDDYEYNCLQIMATKKKDIVGSLEVEINRMTL